MGSATAWHLSKEGENVLLLEQQNEEYTFGSSFGETRICRSLGPRNDIWSYLHRRAITETEDLIKYLTIESENRHSMTDIYTTSPVTYLFYTNKKRAAERLLKAQSDPYEYASTSEEAKDKFGVVTDESSMIIREIKEHTGTINPKALISKLHQAIRLKGNEILYTKKATSVKRKGSLYEIEILDANTEKTQTLQSKKVISAAGPYTGELLKNITPYASEVITPKRAFLVFFKISKDRYHSYSTETQIKIKDFYPMLDMAPDHIFAMFEKVDDDGIPLLKIGGHFLRREISNLDDVWKQEVTKEEIEWSKKSTLDYFTFLNIPLEKEDLEFHHGYSCVYSLTESEVPIVDFLQQETGESDLTAVMLGGMSGVGAKGSMTYGKIASNLLLGKDEDEFMYQKVKSALRLNKD